MVDDERGPCGDVDASKGVQGVSMNEGDPRSQTQMLRALMRHSEV